MQCILPGIGTLTQHLQHLKAMPDDYRPSCCPSCGKSGMWCHGTYQRKADREGSDAGYIGPVPIPRFYCRHCHHTCSALPECIPPRRWYLWAVQQTVVVLCLAGESILKISERVIPSARTVWRWWSDLRSCFAEHTFPLRHCFSFLGRYQDVVSFWQALLCRISLSEAMRILHESGVTVP